MKIPNDQFTQTLNRFLIEAIAPNFEGLWMKILIGSVSGGNLLGGKITSLLKLIGASDGVEVDLDLLQKMVDGAFEAQPEMPVYDLVKPFVPEGMEKFIQDEGLSLSKADAEGLFRRLNPNPSGEQA